MDEEVFNVQLRKFLKKVGISSQREIEKAVREAIASGKLDGSGKINAQMKLEISELDLTVTIEDQISLE